MAATATATVTDMYTDAHAPTQWARIFPQRLTDNYKHIHTLLRPLKSGEQTAQLENIVKDLEYYLNDCVPQTPEERTQRDQEFLHYHKDPHGYYQHLIASKLRFLVLWTDYKCITNHFRVRNIIHIRWTGEKYECLVFDKTKRYKQFANANDSARAH